MRIDTYYNGLSIFYQNRLKKIRIFYLLEELIFLQYQSSDELGNILTIIKSPNRTRSVVNKGNYPEIVYHVYASKWAVRWSRLPEQMSHDGRVRISVAITQRLMTSSCLLLAHNRCYHRCYCDPRNYYGLN